MSRTHQFFTDHIEAATGEATLQGGEHTHLKRVLRLKPGDRILISGGNGTLYHAEIMETGTVRTRVRLLAPAAIPSESPLGLTLIQAIPKRKKMEWILQKSTELGVSRIVPALSERCIPHVTGERARRRHERWKQILKEAAKQAYRGKIPTIAEVIPFEEAVETGEDSFRVICDPHADLSLRECLEGVQDIPAVTVAIGPEGGFTPREAQWAQSRGFIPCHLGPRTLRLETAVIKALSILQFVLGDG